MGVSALVSVLMSRLTHKISTSIREEFQPQRLGIRSLFLLLLVEQGMVVTLCEHIGLKCDRSFFFFILLSLGSCSFFLIFTAEGH